MWPYHGGNEDGGLACLNIAAPNMWPHESSIVRDGEREVESQVKMDGTRTAGEKSKAR